MRFWRVLLLTMSLLVFPAGLVHAEAPPPPSRTLPELQVLLPNLTQLPPGMVVQENGERTADEIAATFPNPAEALEMLALNGADWRYNTYRVYVAQPDAPLDTPARIEVSLHQFSSAGGAAFMLPYFANGRAIALDQNVQASWLMGPCRSAVIGVGEVTFYVRLHDLLMRVTVVSQEDVPGGTPYYGRLQTAHEVVAAVLSNAGSSRQLLDQTCQ